ncbi:phage repressor protein/antirepressor Ant, partial [Gilliamella sp. Lep-s5]
MTYISEANLFRLIIKSKQEKAVIFEEWVMEDLLSTIRKTGSYSLTINSEQQQNWHLLLGEYCPYIKPDHLSTLWQWLAQQ